jgi:hypothetical protein
LSSALLPDAVVEVFSGQTLEEAMAAALAALGDDLTVQRARKVRKGVPGLKTKEHYEVLAVPARPAASSEDAVESAFDALLEQVEQVEQAAALPRSRKPGLPARPSLAEQVPHPAPLVAEHAERLPVPRQRKAPAAPTTPPTATPTAPPTASPTRRPTATAKPVRKRPTKAVARVTPQVDSGGWSRAVLVDLGVPEAVLSALPARDPGDDLAWVAALAQAIGTVLPDVAVPGPDTPLVMSAYGVDGAVALLHAAVLGGYPPSILIMGERSSAATPTEIALVLRSAVTGWRP